MSFSSRTFRATAMAVNPCLLFIKDTIWERRRKVNRHSEDYRLN
jgi:hypothetical protein